VVLLAVAAVILIGVIAVAIGRGGELEPAEADYRPVDLDEVTSTDVALVRPPTALFGYQREATDAAFGQIARAISEQEVEIATLRRQLAEHLPVRASPALRPDPPLRPEPLPPEAGPAPRAGPPTRPPIRPPARLPAEPPADEPWQPPQAPLPPRPVSSWPPPATTKAGSLLPEPMPNSSMPHIPRTGRDQAEDSGPAGFAAAPDTGLPSGSTQPPGPLPVRPVPSRPAAPAAGAGAPGPSGPAAGSHGPDQGSLPSRPSVLHRELADRPGPPQPGAEADPWLVWQRRSDAADPDATGAGAADTETTDPGEQR
jgi:hypothetical protein